MTPDGILDWTLCAQLFGRWMKLQQFWQRPESLLYWRTLMRRCLLKLPASSSRSKKQSRIWRLIMYLLNKKQSFGSTSSRRSLHHSLVANWGIVWMLVLCASYSRSLWLKLSIRWQYFCAECSRSSMLFLKVWDQLFCLLLGSLLLTFWIQFHLLIHNRCKIPAVILEIKEVPVTNRMIVSTFQRQSDRTDLQSSRTMKTAAMAQKMRLQCT